MTTKAYILAAKNLFSFYINRATKTPLKTAQKTQSFDPNQLRRKLQT